MVEFIEKTGTTEESFAEAVQRAVGNKDPSWEPIQAWLKKTDYEYFVEVMRKKHMTMKQLGGDEQVVFSDDDEDTES
jgi:arsenate reductase-like glutaredoxin family protein